MKWFDILKIIGPAVLAVIPGGAAIAPLVVAGMQAAEQIPGKTGTEKKALVQEIVAIGAQGANAVAKREMLPPAEVAAVTGTGIDTVVGVVNLIHRAQPPETDEPAL